MSRLGLPEISQKGKLFVTALFGGAVMVTGVAAAATGGFTHPTHPAHPAHPVTTTDGTDDDATDVTDDSTDDTGSGDDVTPPAS